MIEQQQQHAYQDHYARAKLQDELKRRSFERMVRSQPAAAPSTDWNQNHHAGGVQSSTKSGINPKTRSNIDEAVLRARLFNRPRKSIVTETAASAAHEQRLRARQREQRPISSASRRSMAVQEPVAAILDEAKEAEEIYNNLLRSGRVGARSSSTY